LCDSIQFSASTLPQFGIAHGRRPIALGTGYIAPISSSSERRQQVIVVVTNGWNVLCFNHQLELLWESAASEHGSPSESYHKEVSIIVSPVPVRDGDTGLVVVSGRLMPLQTLSPSERIMYAHWASTVANDHELGAALIRTC
jgi:hypothetical protein